jgi:hypothetical protein
VRDHLANTYQFFLGDSGGAQKLGPLYTPGSVDSAQLAPHAEIADLIEDWEADVNGDAILDLYGFTRTPLVVDLVIGGHPLQIIVAHRPTGSRAARIRPRSSDQRLTRPPETAGLSRSSGLGLCSLFAGRC